MSIILIHCGSIRELTSLVERLKGGSDEDPNTQIIQLHKLNGEKTKKIENLKQLITGQHEIIENYKSREHEVQAERQHHREEVARLEVRIKTSCYIN